jgi:lipoprotein-anchoring transpeptidase ErfK/SrfK
MGPQGRGRPDWDIERWRRRPRAPRSAVVALGGAAALAVAGLVLTTAVPAGRPVASSPAGLVSEGGAGRAAAAPPGGAVVSRRALGSTAAATPDAGPAGPPALIATLSAPTAYWATPGGPPVATLAATNPFGAPQVLAVIGGTGAGGWLRVELPIRPNGSTGWIPATGVELTETYYRVAVSLAARTLTVTDAGRVVFTTPVSVGAPATPTPPDDTYLWELVRPDDPDGVYGPYIFGLAEYSDAYTVFNGGDAQIGIHGQDEPWTIGQAASNGCVRLPNDAITELAGLLPLGTPVTIS